MRDLPELDTRTSSPASPGSTDPWWESPGTQRCQLPELEEGDTIFAVFFEDEIAYLMSEGLLRKEVPSS